LVSTDPAYVFDSWTVTGATGNTDTPGEVSFYMPSNAVTVIANFSLIPSPTPTPTPSAAPTTTTIAPSDCYYYTNNSMNNFAGSVTLCGGSTGYDEIAIGQESNYCLSEPPFTDGFTATTPCTAPATTTTTVAPTTTTVAPTTTTEAPVTTTEAPVTTTEEPVTTTEEPVTTTEAPSACYYYTNNTMDNFGGSVTLCGGGIGFDEIAIGQESNYCLSLPPADGFTATTAC
jgi:hypothetical protein